MINIIELAQRNLTQSKFQKSDSKWNLCCGFQYYCKRRQSIIWILLRWTVSKDWMMSTFNTYILFFIKLTIAIPMPSNFWKSDKNWILFIHIQYYNKEKRNISGLFSPPAAIPYAVICKPNTLYDQKYRSDFCNYNAIKILKIRLELMAVQSDSILYLSKEG